MLTRAAIEQSGYERVDIQVDPENELSLRIPRRLGFTEEGRLRRRLDPKEDGGARRDSVLFSLLADELPGSRCVSFAYRGYDAIGRDA